MTFVRIISLGALLTLASAALIVIWAATWQRTASEQRLIESNALAQQRSVAIILSENLTQVVDRGRLLALSLAMGKDIFGDPVVRDLGKMPHLLIAGATGTGKSEFLRLLISGWLNRLSPVELSLIDFKGGATMAQFANRTQVVALATDLETTSALTIANALEQQLIERQLALGEVGAQNIEAFWEHGRTLSRRFVVIDELGELLRQHPRLSQVLEQIAARGRSLGMHLVVSNQSLSGVSRALLVNLRARIAIGEMDPVDLSQLGFRNRGNLAPISPNWRSAKFRRGSGLETEFTFPIGF